MTMTMTTVFQRVGPFEILEELGRGGMAAVFLARDTRNDASVALKLVPMRQDREHREILEAERSGAKLQAELSTVCPLVPRVFEDGDVPHYYFIAMEYVAGENLSEAISRGPMEPARAVTITTELCRFLEAAHGFTTVVDGRAYRSLVHGDLKPRNVRLAPDGAVKVLDFGIAKALALSRKVTRNDFGSMPYLSPERLDSVEVDAHADLWAVGVLLHEMLTGTPPFHARDTRRLEEQIRNGYARRTLPAGAPPALQSIVARLLAPTAEERYASAGDIVLDLERFTRGEPTEAEKLGWPRQVDDAPTMRTRPAEVMDEATRRTKPAAPAADATSKVPTRPGAPAAAAATPAAVPVPAARPARLTRRIPVRAVLLFIAFIMVTNEVRVSFAAGRVAAAAATQDFEGLGPVWEDYDNLLGRSFLGVGVMRLERALRQRVLHLAEQVIANYRAGNPSIRERQWSLARLNLQQALAIDPTDRRLRAAFAYCEGHLRRIDGEAAQSRRQTIAANQHFTAAIAAFREAAELRSDWPDPFLGLARTFIYGTEELDRATDALRQAERHGYKPGDRETAQLADGYRVRATKLTETARQLRDLPQEPEYLRRSLEAFKEALTLYERIPGYPGVARNLRRVRDSMEQTEFRLAEVEAITGLSEAAGRWE